jgi:hypothetical protein
LKNYLLATFLTDKGIRKMEYKFEANNAPYTNMMTMRSSNDGSGKDFYFYRKHNIKHCKCTFIDGSVYWQKINANDRHKAIRSEPDTLYLDEACTVLADVTRNTKVKELKRMGLIQ